MVRLILVFQLLVSCAAISASPIHEVPFRTIDGKLTSLSELKEGPVLIVNVASECGYTGQYAGLQILHERYAKRGLTIVAFPCNDFGGQEPGSEDEIKEFCKKKFNVTFPMASKIKVKGDKIHSLYKLLTRGKKQSCLLRSFEVELRKILDRSKR